MYSVMWPVHFNKKMQNILHPPQSRVSQDKILQELRFILCAWKITIALCQMHFILWKPAFALLLVQSLSIVNTGRWRNPRVRWTLVRYTAPVREDARRVTLLSTIRCDTRHVKHKQRGSCWERWSYTSRDWPDSPHPKGSNASSDSADDDVRGEGGRARASFLRCVFLFWWEGNSCSSVYRQWNTTVCELSRLPSRDQIFKVSDLCCSRVAPTSCSGARKRNASLAAAFLVRQHK